MKVIHQNPYRTLGIFGNASEKELQKQIATITRYAEVGKAKSFEIDFTFLGEVKRDAALIKDAASKIEQAKNKVHHALFWFINDGHIDEAAFNHLKEGNHDKAIGIWEKTIKEEINSKNFSSLSNIGTLKLALAFSNGSVNTTALAEGIKCKVKLIDSNGFSIFVEKVADKTYSISGFEQVKHFIDEVWNQVSNYIDKTNGIKLGEVVQIISASDNRINKYLTQKLIEDPLHVVETKIEKSEAQLKENHDNGIQLGKKLLAESKADIQKLKTILGKSNMQYILIADKLANQIFQCAIKYFNKNRDTNIAQVGKSTLEVLNESQPIAEGAELKNRFKDDIEYINKWIKDQPDSENAKTVATNILTVNSGIDKLADYTYNDFKRGLVVKKIDALILELAIISNAIGETDSTFVINLSSRIVRVTANLLVGIVNEQQDEFSSIGKRSTSGLFGADRYMPSHMLGFDPYLSEKRAVMQKLKTTLNDGHEIFKKLKKMKMNSDASEYFNKTSIDLIKLRATAHESLGEQVPSDGCYIATMAYGDYDHPQVMVLRNFRDEHLTNSISGRWIIKFYYATSPKLVTLLKDRKKINSSIRFMLNQLIKLMR